MSVQQQRLMTSIDIAEHLEPVLYQGTPRHLLMLSADTLAGRSNRPTSSTDRGRAGWPYVVSRMRTALRELDHVESFLQRAGYGTA